MSEDDALAARALAGRGVRVEPAVWDAADVDWTAYDAVVLRSCWDYHERPAQFRDWIDRIERDGARLWNPAPLVRWNTSKTYLLELEKQGVMIPPTAVVPRAGTQSLSAIMAERRWACAVIKPAVSADGHRTWTATSPVLQADDAQFAESNRRSPLLVQEYVEAIEKDGEYSLMFIAGRYTHAALKRPRPGDFRVQSRFGGTAERAEPPASIVADATRVAGLVPEPWLYARVDGCVIDGRLVLMELEMTEPSLFFGLDASAPVAFADALIATL